MDYKTLGSFDHYAFAIAAATPKELNEGDLLRKFTIGREGPLTACYAPFDFIAPDARLVVVGITPGRTQAVNALVAASNALKAGKHAREASRLAKLTGSFSGAMRVRLVAMLDHIGLAAALDVASCADLFDSSSGQVHFTSALRYPVFVGGANYNGKPDMLETPLLRSMIDSCLVEEARCLSKAVWLPLGPEPARALQYLCEQGWLDRKQVLRGLPHPSGANAERISYFLGRKPRHLLSSRTNASTLDAAPKKLCLQVQALSASVPVSAPAA
jgi:hypothetical protein